MASSIAPSQLQGGEHREPSSRVDIERGNRFVLSGNFEGNGLSDVAIEEGIHLMVELGND